MTLTVSAPVKIGAIAALLLAVVSFGAFRLLATGGTGEESVADLERIELPRAKAHRTAAPAAKPATHKAAAKPHVEPRKKARPAPVERIPRVEQAAIKAARQAGLPEVVAQALGRHSTVVVSLYDPYSQVDGIAFAEAKAGAALAGVGFVPVSVLSQPQVGKLTEKLGLLPDPGILVYVRPGALAAKIGGFADKETVAQAAQNAAHPTP